MAADTAERLARVETRQDNTDRIIEEFRAGMQDMRAGIQDMRAGIQAMREDTDRRVAETDRRIAEMREDTDRRIDEIRAAAGRASEENRATRMWLAGTIVAILLGVPSVLVGLYQMQGSWVQRELDAQNGRIEHFEAREAARDARIAGVEEGLKQQKRDFDDFRRETAERFTKMDERFDRIESLIMGLHGKNAPRAEADAPRPRR